MAYNPQSDYSVVATVISLVHWQECYALYARYNELLNENEYGQKYDLGNVQMFIIEGIDKVRDVIEKNHKRKLAKHKKLSNNTIVEIDNCSPLELLKLQNNLIKIAEGEGISFVYEKRQKKSEIQFLYEELEECGTRLIKYKECYSKDFLETDEVLVNLPRIFSLYLDEDIYMECERLDRSEADCIKYVVDNVIRITNLKNFGEHLTLMLELDAFFLNEDRNFHNIAVI